MPRRERDTDVSSNVSVSQHLKAEVELLVTLAELGLLRFDVSLQPCLGAADRTVGVLPLPGACAASC